MASKTLLVLTLITTFLETLLYSGVVYGWTSIHKVFVQEGFFLPQNSTASSTASSVQNSQLSLVFTVSTSVAPVANFFTGALLDCKGIWKTRTLLLILQCVGYLLIALVGASFSRILFLAVPLLDIGGYGMLTVNSQISNLYPRYRSAVITTLCGCFISSSVVFWVFKVFYLSFGFSLKSILLCAASFSVLLHLRTFLLMPRHTVPEILPPDFKYGYHELHKANKTSHKTKAKDLDANSNSIKGVRRTFTQNLFTKKTLTNIFHFCILQLGLIFFIGNFNSIITRVVPNNKVSFHTQIYAIIQSCGVLICPICGVLMDRLHFALQSSNNKKNSWRKTCCILHAVFQHKLPLFVFIIFHQFRAVLLPDLFFCSAFQISFVRFAGLQHRNFISCRALWKNVRNFSRARRTVFVCQLPDKPCSDQIF